MQLPRQEFKQGDKIFFISVNTATRVTRGTVKNVDEDRGELLVRYKTAQGFFAVCIVKFSNALKVSYFKTTGKAHHYCLINIRNQLALVPIVENGIKKVKVAIGGHVFGYTKFTVVTGNFIPN